MNPLLDAKLRRQLPLLFALLASAVFLVVHSMVFGPMVQRYQRALQAAGKAGAVFDGARVQAMLPPRVNALLLDHSLSEADANQKSRTGLLGAELVQQLSDVAGRNGLAVIVAEPGSGGESPSVIQPRAHLRLRGRYSQWLGMLDDLARSGSLVTVERFTLSPVGDGVQDIDLFASGFILRRGGARP